MPATSITSLADALREYKPKIEQRGAHHFLYFGDIEEASNCLIIINSTIPSHQQIQLALDEKRNLYALKIASDTFTKLHTPPPTAPTLPLAIPVAKQASLMTQARYPYQQFYIKNLSGDNSNFFQKFLITITHLPNDKHEPLRQRSGPKRRYGVKGTHIIDREEKKKTGRGQYSPEEKQGFSKHQSTTYINTDLGLTPQLYIKAGDTSDAQVAFMFPQDSVLINRIFIYSGHGGTVGDPYAFNTPWEAEEYIRRSTKKGGASRPFSFDTIKELEEELTRIHGQRKLTEILARLRFQTNSCAIAISNNTNYARWLAAGYATRIKQRLLYRKPFYQNDTTDAYEVPYNYKVPIFYYLPSNQALNLMAYTPQQQKRDHDEALNIYRDPIQKSNAFAHSRFEFLLCVDPNQLLTEHYTNTWGSTAPLLDYIIQTGKGHIAELIYMKASPQAQSDYVHMQRTRTDLIQLLGTKFDEMLESVKYYQTNPQSSTNIFLLAKANRWQEVIDTTLQEKINDRNINYYKEALLLATEENHQEAIDALIKAGALAYKLDSPLAQCTKTGNTPYHWAVIKSNNTLFNTPIPSKHLNVKNRDKLTPLDLAAISQKWEAVEKLAPWIDPTPKESLAVKFKVAITSAIQAKQLLTAKMLIELLEKNNLPENRSVKGEFKENLLHIAVQTNDKDLLKFVLQQKNYCNQSQWQYNETYETKKTAVSPLLYALRLNNWSFASQLMSLMHEAHPNFLNQYVESIPKGHDQTHLTNYYQHIMDQIYLKTKDGNAQGLSDVLSTYNILVNLSDFKSVILSNTSNTDDCLRKIVSPFHLAIESYEKKTLELLFANTSLSLMRCMKNQSNHSPIAHATELDDWDSVQIIAKYIDKIDERTYDSLMYHAVKNELNNIILLMNDKTIIPYHSDYYKNITSFPLHLAAKKSTSTQIQALMQHKDFSSDRLLSANNFYLTPLMIALNNQNYEISQKLIEYHKPAELTSMNIDYSWFIDEAIKKQNHDLLAKIINAAPGTIGQSNYITQDGNLLHLAIQHNNIPVIKKLMQQSDSHLFVKGPSYLINPITCAAENDRWDMIELMRSHLKMINKQNLTGNVKRDRLIDLLQAFDELKSIVTEIGNTNPKQSAHTQAIKNTLESCISETLQFKINPDMTTKHNIEQHMQTLFKQVEDIKPQLGTKIRYSLLNALAYTLAIASVVGLVALIIYAAVQRKPYVFFQTAESKVRAQMENSSEYQHIQKNISMEML